MTSGARLVKQGGNILVTEDGVIKLADFNSSKHLGDIAGAGSNPLKSLAGTPQFMAPVCRLQVVYYCVMECGLELELVDVVGAVGGNRMNTVMS